VGSAEDGALGALRHGWGEAYEIWRAGDGDWRARRLDGLGGEITAAGPDELWTAMKDDYALKPVPRGLPQAESGAGR
jgi:hypothetical protein